MRYALRVARHPKEWPRGRSSGQLGGSCEAVICGGELEIDQVQNQMT
jgi:hypothetical protein